jgi:hypothetical protein
MANIDYLRVAKETDGYKVRPAVPQFRDLEILSESLRLEHGYEFLRTVRARRAEVDYVKGGRVVRGDIELYVRPDNFGELLLACLGKVATTGTGPYTHTFTHQDDPTAQLPSYLLDIGVEGRREKRVSGVWVDQIILDVEGSGPLGATVSVIGADEQYAPITADVLSYSSQAPFTGAEVTSFQLGGVEVVPELFSITISNNSPVQHSFKSRTLQRVEYGPLEVTGELSILFTDDSHLLDFIDETERSLTVTFTRDQGNQLRIEVPRLVYEVGDVNLNEQERKVQNLEWRALLPATGEVVTIELTNSVASY